MSGVSFYMTLGSNERVPASIWQMEMCIPVFEHLEVEEFRIFGRFRRHLAIKTHFWLLKKWFFTKKKWVFEFFDFWSYMGKKLMRFEWDHFQPDLRPKQCRNVDFKILDFQIFQIFPDFLDFWHFFLGTQVWRTPHIKLMGGSGVSMKKKKFFFSPLKHV